MRQASGGARSWEQFSGVAIAQTHRWSLITPGGLFPLCTAPAEAEILDNNFWTKGNRPSLGITHGENPEPPGLAILAGYYEKSYAARYSSMFEAERQRGKLIISPLGNLSKPKPDGSLKHRIIQDLSDAEEPICWQPCSSVLYSLGLWTTVGTSTVY